MTNPNDSDANPSIQQEIGKIEGQGIAQMLGGLAVGNLTVYLSQTLTETTETPSAPVDLGKNPYQGLKAFRELDGDRFFGRDQEIKALEERFQGLHCDRNTVRILPIYGPSGSGKSSLARAGLIPALGKTPIPGKEQGRVISFTPGSHPLEALARVMARIVTQDPTPVAKTREFKQELLQPNDNQEFDGLRRIADVFPDIDVLPLIILVDQFEELFTLCEDEKLRHAFVENLRCATSDSSQRVSVIITMRSDFLGATQQHPHLNRLFSTQGFLVPMMQPEALKIAITQPAKNAGYEFNDAIVELLIEEAKEQEGALPLLQFALTQIWEGLHNKIKPIDTFKQIGGVGGALANEAKRIYESLTSAQQKIARFIFLALIQLNPDHSATRRRAPISELITSKEDEPLVREVIERFARRGVWILVTFSNEQEVEMVEVAHEALIQNWQELQAWLNQHWENLIKKRKIEQSALEWQNQGNSKDYLLQGRILRDAKEFQQAQTDNSETSLSGLAQELINKSLKKQRFNRLKFASIFLIFPLIGTLIIVHLQIIKRANLILHRNDCTPDPGIKGLLQYMWLTKQATGLRDIILCDEDLQRIKLSNVMISKPMFDKSNLSNSDFRGVIFSFASFKGASLAEADFSKNAFLMDADFRCVDTECANLDQANFQGADLRNAKFQGASLEQTDFTNSDLEGATGLTEKQLQNAILCSTTMPNDLKDINNNRNCKNE